MNISIRELAQQIAALSRRIDALSAPQLGRSSIEDGAIHEYDVDGNLVSIIGRQEDGSHGVVVVDGPDPLRTSTPIAEAGALTIAARWDGAFIDPDTGTVDASLPAYDDFKHIEVHVGDETSFNPDKNTLAGFIPNRDGGEVSVPAEAGTRYVRFVTRAISGKTSVPSIATMVEVETLVDRAQFDTLRDLLDQAAAWIAETGAELDQRLADAEGDLADAQAGLDEAAERLDTLRDVTLPALYTRLDEAEGRLADIPDLMEDLQDAIDAANAAIDALDIEALRDRLDAAEGDLTRLQDETLPALRDDVEGAQGRLDEAFGEGASWNLSDAFDSAAQAAQDAIDLTPRPHTSTSAPGSTVMPRGTRWEQIDSEGRVIGIWEQTAAPEGASWATRALDLSLLRASSAVIDDLLVERMAVAIATVIELNADRITSGEIDAEFIDVSDLSAALATVLELDAGVITTGELGADRINVADLTAAVATIIELNADQITSGQITSARIDTTDLAATLATILELDAGTITSGTIDTERLDAVELAAEMASFIQARIENLVVTKGATINEAVIEKLWTDVVRSRKITTDMLLVGSGDNLVPNGSLVGDVSEFFTDMSGVSIVEEDGRRALRISGTHEKETDAFEIAPGEYKFSVEARAGAVGTRFYAQLSHDGSSADPYMISNQVIDGTFGFGSSGMWWKTFTGTVTVPESGFGNAVRMVIYTNHSNGVQGFWQEFRGFKLTSMTDASLIVDGAIAARHVDAESIAAEVGEFIYVKAENILAGTIDVLLDFSVAGGARFGDENQEHVRIQHGRVEILRPGESGPEPYISMGQGADGAFRVLDDDGGFAGGVLPDGSFDGPHVETESLSVSGHDIHELLDSRIVSLGEFRMPTNVTYGPSTVDMALIEVTVDIPAGHKVFFDVRGWMRAQNPGTIGLLRASCTLSTTGMPPRPTGASPELLPYAPVTYSTSWQHVSWSYSVGSTLASTARVLFWIYRDSGNDPMARNFVVEASMAKVHGAAGFAGSVRATPGGTGDQNTPPSLVERTERFDLGPHSLWTGNTRAQWGYRLGDIQAGRDGTGLLWDTMILSPQAARNMISASEELVSARIRLHMSENQHTMRPSIGTVRTTAITGSTRPATRNINPGSRTYGPTAPSGWTDVAAHTLTAMKAGDPGFVITYPSTSTPVGRFHGPGASAALRPQLEITVRSRA